MALDFSACTVFALYIYIMIHGLDLSGNYIGVDVRGGDRNLETKDIYVSELQFCFTNLCPIENLSFPCFYSVNSCAV